jgi:hypothetical protein
MNINSKLEFKNNKDIVLGLDIGGSLTKLAVIVKKEKIGSDFLTKYEFIEEVVLNGYILYIRLLQTNSFETEAIPLLKSKT